MRDLIRETVLGHAIRLIGGKAGQRLLPYPEEQPGFTVPANWPPPPPTTEPGQTADGREDVNAEVNSTVQGGRVQDEEAQEVKVAKEIKRTQPDSNVKIVTWYSDTDPSNPQNWSDTKRAVVMFPLCLLTFAVSVFAWAGRALEPVLIATLWSVGRSTSGAASSPEGSPHS